MGVVGGGGMDWDNPNKFYRHLHPMSWSKRVRQLGSGSSNLQFTVEDLIRHVSNISLENKKAGLWCFWPIGRVSFPCEYRTEYRTSASPINQPIAQRHSSSSWSGIGTWPSGCQRAGVFGINWGGRNDSRTLNLQEWIPPQREGARQRDIPVWYFTPSSPLPTAKMTGHYR